MIQKLSNAGQTANCQRCNTICRVAETANTEAQLLRHANQNGYCPNCAITQFIKTNLDVQAILPPGVNVTKALCAPHIQEIFGQLFFAGKAEVDLSGINWELVITNWDMLN